MQDLFERCKKNGLNPTILDQNQLKSLEPNVTGLGAIKVTETGIVDYISMANKMAKEFISNGGEIKLNSEITNLKEDNDHVEIQVRNENKIEAEFLISCAGLQLSLIHI